MNSRSQRTPCHVSARGAGSHWTHVPSELHVCWYTCLCRQARAQLAGTSQALAESLMGLLGEDCASRQVNDRLLSAHLCRLKAAAAACAIASACACARLLLILLTHNQQQILTHAPTSTLSYQLLRGQSAACPLDAIHSETAPV